MIAMAGVLSSQHTASLASERAVLHSSSDWALLAPHLPDPATADAARLEMAGDVLRARRFPEDALDYYGYALAHGGNPNMLMKKMGIVWLELGQARLAREYFRRCARANKKDSEAWNDLGATDYELGAYPSSISEYKRAIRLDRRSAIYFANLGMTYLATKDLDSARAQLAKAAKLDPDFMRRPDSGGTNARVLTTQDYGEFCFEMAMIAANSHQPEALRMWLVKASERGFDIRKGMEESDVLRPWLKDPRVQVILQNSVELRKQTAIATAPGLEHSEDSLKRNATN
jgi:tetratricopeptide (TPR) repeat protein